MSRSEFFIGHRQRGKTTSSVEFIKKELLTTPSLKKLFVVSDNVPILRHIRELHGSSLETNLRVNSGFFTRAKYIGFNSLGKHTAEDKGNNVFFFPNIDWDNSIVQKHIAEMYSPDIQAMDINPTKYFKKEGDLYVFELGITNNVHILV